MEHVNSTRIIKNSYGCEARGMLLPFTTALLNSWVEAEVDAASIDTHNKLRDAHLRSAAFFAVKQYPTIVFQSTHVEHVSDQDYKVTGNLSLHGVTKPVTLDVAYHGQRTIMGV